MRKRLRKKKFLKEFKIYGVSFIIKRNKKKDFENFLDSFIDIIELYNCYSLCSGKKDILEGFIELGKKDKNPESIIEKITTWLSKQEDIEKYKFGKITDANYGPFDEDLKLD